MYRFIALETLWDVEKTCFSQHTDGTAGTIFNVLDCETRHPVLVENRFENSFYGHPSPLLTQLEQLYVSCGRVELNND